MSEKVMEKLSDLGDIVTAIQQKNTKLEKDYDGLVATEIKELTDKATTLSEEIDKLKGNDELVKEQKQKIENLEKLVAMGGVKKKGDFKEYDRALSKYLRKGIAIDTSIEEQMIGHYVDFKNLDMNDDEVKNAIKGLSVQSNPDGGYFVMPERLDQRVSRIFETSPMRQIANVVPTANGYAEMIIDDDEADAEWASEIAARPETDTPKVGLLQVHAHELYAKPKATQKMLDDAGFDVESWLAGKVSRRFTRKENTAFISGDGNLKPKGFLSYAEWASAGTYERNALERILSGSSGDFDEDDLLDMQSSLIEDYHPNSNWLMRRQTFFGKILKFKEATTGGYLFDPQLLKNGAGQIMLLGQPVLFASDMPATGSADAESVALGDFEQGYMIVDKVGIRVLRDPYSDKPHIQFYTTKSVGGAVTNYEAIKILKENS